MKEDYKKCDDEYKSSEAFYKLPRRLQNFFNFAIEYESHEEYRLKTENYDLFYSNYDLSKENRKLKIFISVFPNRWKRQYFIDYLVSIKKKRNKYEIHFK